MDKPRRAHVLKIEIQADDLESLLSYIRHMEFELAAGYMTSGVSGGYNSGSIYTYDVDESITHDDYAEKLNAYLEQRGFD